MAKKSLLHSRYGWILAILYGQKESFALALWLDISQNYMTNKGFFHSRYGGSQQSGASNINALDARVLAFSRTSENGTNFEYLLNSTNLSAKP